MKGFKKITLYSLYRITVKPGGQERDKFGFYIAPG
jgi:hypothetical protein